MCDFLYELFLLRYLIMGVVVVLSVWKDSLSSSSSPRAQKKRKTDKESDRQEKPCRGIEKMEIDTWQRVAVMGRARPPAPPHCPPWMPTIRHAIWQMEQSAAWPGPGWELAGHVTCGLALARRKGGRRVRVRGSQANGSSRCLSAVLLLLLSDRGKASC